MSTIPQSCGKSRILTHFRHFPHNVPHFWFYFEKQFFLQIVIFLAPERNFLRNGSFTVKDFCLYDETSSSKGRRCLHLCMIARWLLLAANVRKMLARPARRRTQSCRWSLFDNNPNYSVTDSVSIVVVSKEITSGWRRWLFKNTAQ